MILPEQVKGLLSCLKQAGYEAYAVGGCVRDTLLGMTPQDWDIASSALPQQILQLFPHGIPTGIAHGTVTVLWEGTPFEVTTFRREEGYSDHRHPDGVCFVQDLQSDLSRRDFTINAMACGQDGKVVDLFGGLEDLKAGVLRCVGEPSIRFEEDALRILRGLRFEASYGFHMEPRTAQEAMEKRKLLHCVAPERIWSEFSRMLCGKEAGKVLRQRKEIVFEILPELSPMSDFDQCNPHHHLDVWEHSCAAVEAVPAQIELRLAMLLHDCGKPSCFSKDEKGIGHFYSHGKYSLLLAEQVVHRLKMPAKLREQVLLLVKLHDKPIFSEEKWIKRQLGKLGEETFFQWIQVKRADTLAQALPYRASRLEELQKAEALAQRLIQEKACVSLRQLAISGKDLLSLGVPQGPEVGKLLNRLMEEVLENRLQNSRKDLLDYASQVWNGKGD